MTEYYFDIESWDPNTTGRPDAKTGRVVAAAYQPIAFGRPRGPLKILKGWEGGDETKILKSVAQLGVLDLEPDPFGFVPVGTNLDFDLGFLIARMALADVRRSSVEETLRIFRDKPRIDIKTCLLLMNEGRFKGSGLDSFTSLKRGKGNTVLGLWERRDYTAIETYIRREAAGFFDVYGKVAAVLHDLGDKMRVRG